MPDDDLCVPALTKILSPHWSTSVANGSIGRILRQGQKFHGGVKIQTTPEMSSHLGLFLTEQLVYTSCYRVNYNLVFLMVATGIPGGPDFRGKMNSMQC